MKQYRHFSEEFKRSLVAQIDYRSISKSAAGRKYNLSLSLLDRWQQQIREGRMQPRLTAQENQIIKLMELNKKKGELRESEKMLFFWMLKML